MDVRRDREIERHQIQCKYCVCIVERKQIRSNNPIYSTHFHFRFYFFFRSIPLPFNFFFCARNIISSAVLDLNAFLCKCGIRLNQKKYCEKLSCDFCCHRFFFVSIFFSLCCCCFDCFPSERKLDLHSTLSLPSNALCVRDLLELEILQRTATAAAQAASSSSNNNNNRNTNNNNIDNDNKNYSQEYCCVVCAFFCAIYVYFICYTTTQLRMQHYSCCCYCCRWHVIFVYSYHAMCAKKNR